MLIIEAEELASNFVYPAAVTSLDGRRYITNTIPVYVQFK